LEIEEKIINGEIKILRSPWGKWGKKGIGKI